MNFAFPAVLVFLLILPGFLFRSRLKRAEQTSLDYSPFGRVVSEAMLWAIVLHATWLGLAGGFGHHVPVGTVLGLLSSSANLQENAVNAVTASSGVIALYLVSLYAFAFVVPIGLRATISRYRLDRSGSPLSPLFRFHDAPWYYLLTGADFEPDQAPDYISVAAVVDVAGQPYLYTGVLADFFFDPVGQLDRVVLENVSRRPLASDKHDCAADRFYPVEGDYLVVRYADAMTLNVKYVKLTKADEATEPPARPTAP